MGCKPILFMTYRVKHGGQDQGGDMSHTHIHTHIQRDTHTHTHIQTDTHSPHTLTSHAAHTNNSTPTPLCTGGGWWEWIYLHPQRCVVCRNCLLCSAACPAQLASMGVGTGPRLRCRGALRLVQGGG